MIEYDCDCVFLDTHVILFGVWCILSLAIQNSIISDSDYNHEAEYFSYLGAVGSVARAPEFLQAFF
jgi:hypothetical protein